MWIGDQGGYSSPLPPPPFKKHGPGWGKQLTSLHSLVKEQHEEVMRTGHHKDWGTIIQKGGKPWPTDACQSCTDTSILFTFDGIATSVLNSIT